jgi:hypothetical protein
VGGKTLHFPIDVRDGEVESWGSDRSRVVKHDADIPDRVGVCLGGHGGW